MTLTRTSVDEWYYTDTHSDVDRAIEKEMEDRYQDAITLNQAFWSEADIDTRFKAGDQTLWSDLYGNIPAYQRKQFYFNRIRRVTNMITGYQRNHRKSLVAVPVGNEDQQGADQQTKLLFKEIQRSKGQECISRCFDAGAVTTGMALINVWLDRSHDPISGDVMCDAVLYNDFLIDPYFKKQDLSDCNFIWRRNWLSKMQLKALFPNRMKEIDMMKARGNRDGKFQFQAQSYNYAMSELFDYDEYWYKDLRSQILLHDQRTGETVEWRGSNEELEEALLYFPNLVKHHTVIPTVKLVQRVNGRIFYHGPNPLGKKDFPIDKYPFVPVLGYYEPELPYFPWRVQGVVRGLRDAQFLYNRRKVIELDILESQVNSGFKYKPKSLVNPKDIYLQGQGKGIALKQNAEMSDVEKIMPADIPNSMFQLSEMLGREIQEIAGVNEELLGMADDDKAGILAMLRQGAGLTTLQILFDQLDTSVVLLGNLYNEVINANYTVGKMARILGEEPSPQLKKQQFLKFDIQVEEGLNTSTQKQLYGAQMLQLFELGLVTKRDVLEAQTFQNKDKIIANIEQQDQQQMQMQQMQLQAQMQLQQAQMESFDAKALADQGLGVERLSRVQENRALAVERLAESHKDRQLALLDTAKALKELDDLDINQIERLVNILQVVKTMTGQPDTEQERVAESAVSQESPSEARGLAALTF